VLTGLAENRAGFVARSDVAAAAAGILIGDGHVGAIYNATGPERLSGADRAGLIAEINPYRRLRLGLPCARTSRARR
jgi:NAD(P)H dehydrogenase (quinone)